MDAQERCWPYVAFALGLFLLSLAAPKYWQWRHRGGEFEDVVAMAFEDNRVARYEPEMPVPAHPSLDLSAGESKPGVDLGYWLSKYQRESEWDVIASQDPAYYEPYVDSSPSRPRLGFGGPDLFAPGINADGLTHLADGTPRLDRGDATRATRQATADAFAEYAAKSAQLNLNSTYEQLIETIQLASDGTRGLDESFSPAGSPLLAEVSSLVGNQRAQGGDADGEIMPPPATEPLGRAPRVATLISRGPRKYQRVDTSAWPRPVRLNEQLRQIGGHADSEAWAAEVLAELDHLHYVRSLDSPAAREALQNLASLASKGDMLAPDVRPLSTMRELRTALGTLRRRIDIWNQVNIVASSRGGVRQVGLRQVESIQPAITAAIAAIPGREAPPAWRRYLLLDEIEFATAASSAPLPPWRRAELARATLEQMHSPRLGWRQRELLAHEDIQHLADQLRTWATEPVDAHEVLENIEQYEQSATTDAANRVAENAARYRWSVVPAAAELSRRIDSSYRNANLRVAITGTLLNQWLEQPKPVAESVDEYILNAYVSGHRQTSSRLSLRLIPDDDQWRMGLEAHGTTYSDATSYADGASFATGGHGQFAARKLIVVEKDRVKLWRTQVNASHETEVYGVSTRFGGLPLLGDIARNRALGEFQGNQWAAKQEIEARMRARVAQQVDAEAVTPIQTLRRQFQDNFFQPLDKLGMMPQTQQLETTDKRIVGHYRLAGVEQLAATTPRPWAPQDCLASAQVHESAINNILAGLQLEGRRMSPKQIREELYSAMDRADEIPNTELSDDTYFTFAERDAVTLTFHEGRVELKLRFTKVEDDGLQWDNIEAASDYAPDVSTGRATLRRSGSTRLKGENLGIHDQVDLRGIFSKTFRRFEMLHLIPASLAETEAYRELSMTQYVIRDGWIGLAWGTPQQAQRVADMRPEWLSR